MAEKKGDDGNEGLPFGLCEKYDIRIDPSWSPRDAWNALERIGVYPPWSNKGGRQYSPTESGKTYYRQNASYGEILAADKRASAANVPTAVKFNRLHTKHHADHAREMGYKNMRDYEAAAVEFFNSKKGKLYYSAARDRYYRYDEKTGYFCSASGDTVHTFKYVTKKEFYRKIKQDKLYEQ